MMDPTVLSDIPHPAHYSRSIDFKHLLRIRTRTSHPARYYYIDFGISVYIPPDASSKLVVGGHGRDQEAPELSFDVAYDPFKLDIFIIGNMFRKVLYSVGSISPYAHMCGKRAHAISRNIPT